MPTQTTQRDAGADGGRQTKSQRLRAELLNMIEVELSPRDQLPTERMLAERFSVSRPTVRQVLARLESESRIYRAQGSGTFVSEPRISKSLELTSFSEDMEARGLVPGSRVLEAVLEPAGPTVGYALQLSPRAEVVHIHRVRTADATPMCIEHSFIPAALVPGLLEQPLDGSLYELLATRYRLRLDHADQQIRATVLDRAQAEALDAPEFSPALEVRRTNYDARLQRYEYAESVYRGDRYFYDLAVYRQGSRG